MRTPAAAERRPRSAPEMLEAFLGELERRRYSPSLQEQVRRVIPALFSHLRERGQCDLRGVTEGHLDAYARALVRRKTRYGRPPALATQAVTLARIRGFFAYLVRRRWILHDPAKDLTVPRADTLPRTVLSVAQARRLMSAPQRFNARWWWSHVEARDLAILELMYGSGLRRGECLRLDLADVDLLERQVLVRNGKGRKDRIVPLTPRAAVALDAYLREARPAFLKDREDALFTTWEGRRLKPVSLQVIVRRRAQAAGLPPISPHVLRHTCATHLLKGGADVRHVQELLGHADIESTTRYTRVAVADLAQLIERCHPREREWARRGHGRR